jgi:succinate dehydrogenase hydrophobic anchor subunit
MEYSTKSSQASLIWIIQAISGVFLIIMLAIHMVANHFVVEGGLQTYSDVVKYLSNPLIFVHEILFLGVVTIHALLGVRAILFDMDLSHQARLIVSRGLASIGVVAVGYGTWLSFLIISR